MKIELSRNVERLGAVRFGGSQKVLMMLIPILFIRDFKVRVNAVVYYRVMESTKAVVEVENYVYATSQLAQTTLRSVCG